MLEIKPVSQVYKESLIIIILFTFSGNKSGKVLFVSIIGRISYLDMQKYERHLDFIFIIKIVLIFINDLFLSESNCHQWACFEFSKDIVFLANNVFKRTAIIT